MNDKDFDEIKQLAQKWKDKEGNLIMILHEVQNRYGYIPRGVSLALSRELDMPLARIYEVITFYNYFKLVPPAKHHISVCMGTACYLKGAPEILTEIKDILHVEEGQTTADGNFRLDVGRCLGGCGLAPVMMIDDKVYGKVKRSEIMDTLSRYVGEEESVKA
jgi:NADH-quinone oxidoreductase subunit E